ncbi:hypothetical protein DRQ05_03650 [bacterium]|nr:MAG: hypothetical protein DRQ05_03650 [bacterium]
MKRASNIVVILLAVVLSVSLIGCGKSGKEKAKKGAKSTKEEFKMPDSLLTPIASYNLVRDDYHPIKGGVMANEEIELQYPASNIARYIAVKTFGLARDGLNLVKEKIGPPADGRVVLIGAKDLDEYKLLTRKEWWYYGDIKGDTIYFEPFDIMIKRSIAKVSIAQKLAQMALIHKSKGRIPIWMREAIASYVAGEGDILKMQANEFRYDNMNLNISPDEIKSALTKAVNRADTRIAFYAAYRMLGKLLEFSTMDHVVEFVDYLGQGLDMDKASKKAFGMDYNALIDRIRVDREAGAGKK